MAACPGPCWEGQEELPSLPLAAACDPSSGAAAWREILWAGLVVEVGPGRGGPETDRVVGAQGGEEEAPGSCPCPPPLLLRVGEAESPCQLQGRRETPSWGWMVGLRK